MKRALLIVAGLLVVALVALVAWFPASWAWRMASGPHDAIKVGQIEGSLWHGRAKDLDYAGVDLGTLDWRLSPAFLWGRTELTLRLTGDVANGHAELARRGAETTLSNLHLEVVVDTLPVWLGTPPMSPRGTLVVDIPKAVLRERWPRQLSGYVAWEDTALADRFNVVPLGNLRADLSERNGTVLQATFSDGGGPLALSGTAQVSLLGWRVDAVLRTRKDTTLMHRVIAQFGQPSTDGSLHIDKHGGLTLGEKP